MSKQTPQTRTHPFGPPQNGAVPAAPHSQPGAPARAGPAWRKVAAVLLIVGAAVVGGAILARSGGGATSALATSHGLRAGDTIGASDLTTVQVKINGGGAATIPASQRSAILGQRATGPLAAGSILSPSSVSKGPQLAPGEVGLALADLYRAAQGILTAGQTVLIVGQQAQAGGQQVPLAAAARVLGIAPASATSGKVIVDLALANPADATPVASAASSTAGVRLVVVAQGGGSG